MAHDHHQWKLVARDRELDAADDRVIQDRGGVAAHEQVAHHTTPWSKRVSTGTRESMQPSTNAYGAW